MEIKGSKGRAAESQRTARDRAAPDRAARDRTALSPAIVSMLALTACGLTRAVAAQPPELPVHFHGLLNDYTPLSANGAAISGSPYEMHGKWTLELNEERHSAKFSAEMTMETADFANPDPTKSYDPTKLKPHTHHFSVTDGVLHDDPTGDPINWMASCPQFSPAAKDGFVVTGSAYVTVNGANVPFANPTPVTICVLGSVSTGIAGTAHVTYSNFTLTFAPPPAGGMNASSHFGTQPVNGVITRCDAPPRPFGLLVTSNACAVAVDE